MFKYLVVSLILEVSLTYLKVYGPECAVNRLPKDVQYTLSNFGQIPYGQTMIGQIRLPKNPLLCSTQNQVQTIANGKKDTNTKDILLVKRGICKFTQKVINAQNLGADIIIIYDNEDSDKPNVIMKNDGHGHLAEIPSLFISKTHGQGLLATSNECKDLPLVKVQFEIDQKQKSQVTLWLDAGNRQTYILARDFYKNDYFEAIQDRVQFSMRFRVQYGCDNWQCNKDDCVVGNVLERFCRTIIKQDNPGASYPTGTELIAQQLRQYFLWEELKSSDQKTKWWRYMTKFDHQVCLSMKDITDCSYSVMRTVQIPQNIITSIKANVQKTYSNLTENKANMLNTSYQESRNHSIFFYPEATINGRNFYGLFKAPEVFQTICNSLIDPPQECIRFIKKNHEIRGQDDSSDTWKTIVVILSLMTLGFLVALFIYTKIIKKEVNQQLSVQVNKMVENYVNLANKKNTSTSNSYSKFDS